MMEDEFMKKTIKWSCCLLALLQFSTGTTRVMADSFKETSVEKMSQPATKNQKEKGDQTTWQLITSLGEEAREIAQEEDLYASVMLAQAILESNSGQSQLSQAPYYNLFGVKGQGASFKTLEEDSQGKMYTTQTTFKKYNNYEDSLGDYVKLIKNGIIGDKNFYQGSWKTNAENYRVATRFLTGRYATDHKYHEKLNQLIEDYELTRYDHKQTLVSEKADYIRPLDAFKLTSKYGKRNDSFHRGVDLAAPQGTKIKASREGKVTRAAFHPSWGNYVTVQHSDGLTTLYAHCEKINVEVGQLIEQGEKIASVGSTGHSTGPHLHFEVNRSQNLEKEQLLDPVEVLEEEVFE
ncbi:peptidoglycan DD-metalloendopeptidase family protein [Tetragenococcus halophilus]|uniref:Peptidoglycan DD-metalloendopeptidase family protein n=2 Tax=Tetragenococcus halophilus TaxID=51669 RepID=A0AB37D1Z6_TETHA|nr:peptidoglycan DD-metalloendopeptidase family protein [Tetragenococcus halophilus]QGP76246.1 peptidoglycan DD-metalloendopeptidase family protein [Tetragenococcus halophilus]